MAKRAPILLTVIGVLAVLPHLARAHTGPPTLVLHNAAAGPYTLTLWADPDVGTASFLVTTAETDASQPSSVAVRLRPADGHLPELGAPAQLQQGTGAGRVFLARVPLDAAGAWNGVVEANGPAGRGVVAFEVLATAGAPEWLALVPSLLAIGAAAMVWWLAVRRRPAPPGETAGLQTPESS